jgi:hypothetical protein
MFGENFLDVQALLIPNSTYFFSPFFGLIPAFITQGFLLRRCLLFISSLFEFWPRLAHPASRWSFGVIMTLLIFFGNAQGAHAAYHIWQSPNLWSLGRVKGSNPTS